MRTVGAYEAKTHLSQLLDAVAAGESVGITRHGVEVARLVPPAGQRQQSPAQVIAALREARRGVTLDGLALKSLIEEGRRS